MKASMRTLERLENSHNIALAVEILQHDKIYICELIDFHSQAIKIRIPPQLELTNNSELKLKINSMVFRTIQLENLKVLKRNNREYVINLASPKSEKSKVRSQRVIPRSLKCTILFTDPNSSTRKIFGNIIDLSGSGLKLQTSLTNKHLLCGMKIFNLQIDLAVCRATVDQAEIASIRHAENGLELSLKFSKGSNEYQNALFKFALVNGVDFDSIDFIAKKNKVNITDVLSIQPIENKSHNEDIMELRFKAYSCANKLDRTATVNDLWDDYDPKSIILGVKIGATLIGTARLLRCQKSDDSFQFEKYFKLRPEGKFRSDYFEVSRLAIDPRFQGTDILIAIFSYIFEMVLKGNLEGVYCFCTPNLVNHYKRISGRVIERRAIHPVTGDEMFLLRLDRNNVILGKKMPSISWLMISKNVVDHLMRYGYMFPKYNVNMHFIKSKLEKIALRIIKKIKARS